MELNKVLFLLFLSLGLHAEKSDKLDAVKTNIQARILTKKIENNNIDDKFVSLLSNISENAKLLKYNVIKNLGKSLKVIMEKAEENNQELYDKLLEPYMTLEYNFEGRNWKTGLNGF